MKNLIQKDKKCRLLFRSYEYKRLVLKSLLMSPTLPFPIKSKIQALIAGLPRNSSLSRVRNRCIFTGRPRGVYRKFKVSRIIFRSLASNGLLPGLKKSSW